MHCMTSDFASSLLRTSATGLAALAAEQLLDQRPDIRNRFAPDAFRSWQEVLSGNISDLAAAVADGSVESFLQQVQWTRVAFARRDLPVEDLQLGLLSLKEVAREELPAKVFDLAGAYLDRALENLQSKVAEAPTYLSNETAHGRLSAQYVLAILEGERLRACRMILDEVRAARLDVRTAFNSVLCPALREMGRMWHLNEAGITEEHFGSSTTRHVISQLLLMEEPAPAIGKSVLCAATQGVTHDIGITAVAGFFELDGWRVIDLGADVPAQEVARAVRLYKVDLVALTATLEAQRRSVKDAVKAVGEFTRADGIDPPPILVGGLAFSLDPQSWKRAGASAWAATADDAVAAGRRLVLLD